MRVRSSRFIKMFCKTFESVYHDVRQSHLLSEFIDDEDSAIMRTTLYNMNMLCFLPTFFGGASLPVHSPLSNHHFVFRCCKRPVSISSRTASVTWSLQHNRTLHDSRCMPPEHRAFLFLKREKSPKIYRKPGAWSLRCPSKKF